MNMALPIGMFAGGLLLIIVAVATGDAEVSLVLIFPVFSGSSGTFLLGVLLIVASFLVGFAMIATGQASTGVGQISTEGTKGARGVAGEPKYGGVLLIGPVPIAFGSSRSMALAMLVIGIVMAVIIVGLVLAF